MTQHHWVSATQLEVLHGISNPRLQPGSSSSRGNFWRVNQREKTMIRQLSVFLAATRGRRGVGTNWRLSGREFEVESRKIWMGTCRGRDKNPSHKRAWAEKESGGESLEFVQASSSNVFVHRGNTERISKCHGILQNVCRPWHPIGAYPLDRGSSWGLGSWMCSFFSHFILLFIVHILIFLLHTCSYLSMFSSRKDWSYKSILELKTFLSPSDAVIQCVAHLLTVMLEYTNILGCQIIQNDSTYHHCNKAWQW